MRSVFVVAAMVLLLSSAAGAEIPQVMGYQGRITDNAGNPVADGTYTMQFRIYDNAGGSGSPLWDSGTVSVQFSDGTFGVMLGESPQPAITLAFDQDYWMLVTFDGEDQGPPNRMGSVGYAYMASGLVPGTVAMGNVNGAAAIKGHNTDTSGDSYGLYGRSDADEGIGVYGWASSTSGETYGGRFNSDAAPYGTGVRGDATATTGPTYGVYGRSNSSSGTGVHGVATHTSGANYGVYGTSSSTEGAGVYGSAAASWGDTYGVYGTSASDHGTGICGKATATSEFGTGVFGESAADEGFGVYGQATHPGGYGYGGYFRSLGSSGTGVWGEATSTSGTGQTCGGHFKDNSPSGTGVCGVAAATTGTGYGVQGETATSEGAGVYGLATNVNGEAAYGVQGKSDTPSGVGVWGEATNTATTTYGGRFYSNSPSGAGVQGTATAATGDTYGGYFTSYSSWGIGVLGALGPGSAPPYTAAGVYGRTLSTAGSGTAGVLGEAANDDHVGVRGRSPTDGVWGTTTNTAGPGIGVYGASLSTDGHGVLGAADAHTGGATGVYGYTMSPGGNGVYYSGGLAGTGSKSCVVRTSQGPTSLYCQESPECWFEDFGEGRLVNGRTHIELDPLFLETVTIDEANPMKVFLEHRGACSGTYVETGRTGFDVVEQNGGLSNVEFCYRVVAKRKGFEHRRLEYCIPAERDPYLYPEMREKLRRIRVWDRARTKDDFLGEG